MKIKKKNDITKAKNYINKSGVLYLYGVIGDYWDDLDALSVVRTAEEISGDHIEVRIKSPGGNVLEGLAMYNALKQSSKSVFIYIDGIAASMAGAVACAGDKVFIPSNALFMAHKPSLECVGGNANDLRDVANGLDSLEGAYVQCLADKTGKTSEEIAELIADGKNHFFRGQEAIDFGFADELIGEVQVAAQANFNQLGIPADLTAKLFSSTAAAAVSQKPEVKIMKFKIKSENGGIVMANAIVVALVTQFDSISSAVAFLSGRTLSSDSEKILTGEAVASDSDLESMAAALNVDTKVLAAQPASPDLDATAQLAVAAALKVDRLRAKQIREIGVTAEMKVDDVQAFIDGAGTIDQFRQKAIEAMAIANKAALPGGTSFRINNAEPAGLREGMAQAMLVRAVPSQYKHSEASGQFVGLSMLETAKAYLELSGESVRGLGKSELVARAMHTTSDFPGIVADVANQELLRSYNLAPRTFMSIARETSASDFKAKHVVTIGGGSGLEQVNEKGEFKKGTITEGGESYKLKTYGRIFSLSRQLMIDDSLDAFVRFFQQQGGKASQLESDIVWGLIIGNAALSDGIKIFGTGDKRLNQAAGAEVDETTLDAMRKLMRQQKDPDGAMLNNQLKTIAVGANRETQAQKMITSITAGKSGDVNVFANTLELVVEPRLDVADDPFYGFVDPAMGNTIAYCYLDGNRAPYIETQNGFETDGVKLKVRHDFGAGVEDHRGMVKATGVAPV